MNFRQDYFFVIMRNKIDKKNESKKEKIYNAIVKKIYNINI